MPFLACDFRSSRNAVNDLKCKGGSQFLNPYGAVTMKPFHFFWVYGPLEGFALEFSFLSTFNTSQQAKTEKVSKVSNKLFENCPFLADDER